MKKVIEDLKKYRDELLLTDPKRFIISKIIHNAEIEHESSRRNDIISIIIAIAVLIAVLVR